MINRLQVNKKINKGPFRNVKFLQFDDDLLKRGERIIIPESMQNEVIKELHGQHHVGIENTTLFIKARFWWRRMNRQVEELVRNCQSCLACKRQKSPKAELMITPEVFNPRESVSIDVRSMPLSQRGMCCFLLIVDLATKYVAAAALKNQQADSLKHALWEKLFSVFRVPQKLRSDQGKTVDGKVINDLCEYLCIAKEISSPYYPEGNGLAERAIGSVKSLVSVICESRSQGHKNLCPPLG